MTEDEHKQLRQAMTKPTEGPYYWTDGENPIDISTYDSPGYYKNPTLCGKDDEFVIGCYEYWIIGPHLNKPEMLANARLLAKSWEMREAIPTILPDTHGDHGGPLVVVKAFYEDGSERSISPEKYEKVRALLASIDGDNQ